MAFGFEAPVSGLIAAADAVGVTGRFRVDFARAYVDRLTIAPSASSLPLDGKTLTFGETLRTGMAIAGSARHIPAFPDEALRHARPAPRQRRDRALLRVCVFGPESSGKSTLAGALAAHYRCPLAHEYARSYLDAIGSRGTRDDVAWIARGQRATETAAAAQAGPLLICDTNLATVALWSDTLYGDTPGWLRDAAALDRYDLWLLTDIDVPYAEDPQRCFPDPDQRAWFMQECRRTLSRLQIVPVFLQGDHAMRLAAAIGSIDSLQR